MTRIALLCLVLAAACNKAEPTKAEAAKTTQASTKGQTFGAGVKLTSTTPIDAILADPKKYAGQTVRVEGTVTDVCEMRGCWFEVAGDKPGQKLRFKVTDGEMVFPADSKGRRAVAEGVLAVKELSLEDTRAQAEEDAREKGQTFDPNTVTAAKQMVRIDGTGAVFN